jgi:cell division GTPase FtsZ
MSDGIDFDLPMPTGPGPDEDVADSFDYNVAFNLAFIGVGQGGSKIAETFAQIGYGRVCVLNTTHQDLAEIGLLDHQKLDPGGSGAGKNPEIGRAAVDGRDQDIRDLMARNWGDNVDYAFVCFGAGGGTGAGAYQKVTEVAEKYMREKGRPIRVGCIVALPKDTEGQRQAMNAIACIQQLAKKAFAPIIVIDNQRIGQLLNPTARQEYPVVNSSIAQQLHLFNRLAGTDSDMTTFDPQDFATVLDSGLIAFAYAQVDNWADKTQISRNIRDGLSGNLLMANDIRQGKLAALLFVLNGKAYDEVPAAYLDHSVEMLNGTLRDGSTVYQGIYKGADSPKKGSIKALALIGGLPWPQERILALCNKGGVEKGDVAKFLGV